MHRTGAAVELEPGLESFVPAAEMSAPLSVGQEVVVRVLHVGTDEKQIYCSTYKTRPPPLRRERS
jgi:ribosomal protein S1